MKRLKDGVKNVLLNSEAATEAFYNDYLNYSAFAKRIRGEVEAEVKKPVSLGSIVVALSRLKQEEKNRYKKSKHDFIPRIVFDDISVRSSLVELTFNNTHEIAKKIHSFDQKDGSAHEFYYIAYGVSEITLITNAKREKYILGKMKPFKPKIRWGDLAAVTVRLDPDYLPHNTVYAILRMPALHFIDVMEVVSTWTEVNIIVNQSELDKTFHILQAHLKK